MRRPVLVVVSLSLIGLGACKKADDKPKAEPAATAGSADPKPAEDPCGKAKAEGPIAWIHDDYAAALACAKQKGVPLVLDLWAPWCHTCLSMQATVFTDKSFEAVAPKFVFAALDTDREVNAPVVDKFALSAWPTFYVIDPGLRGEPGDLPSRPGLRGEPGDLPSRPGLRGEPKGGQEAVLARFVGAASVAQFHAFLDAGARGLAGGAAEPDARLLAAERALAQKDHATAEQELTAALAAAPADWPRRPDALVSLIGTKHTRKDHAGCVELAERSLDATGSAASASDFLYHATACATALGKDAKDPAIVARVKQLRERAVARWQQLVADTAAPMSVDDRSDAMMNLRETLLLLGKPGEANAVAERQRTMLDAAAAAAADPMHAMTYNWPRAEVYAFLQRPLDLVPALEKSARELPNEYDPPARLGWIYLKANKLGEAARWTEASIKLAYGPRKVRVLTQRAEIAKLQNDRAAELGFREDIIKTLEALPPGQTTPDAIAKAKQAVAELAASMGSAGSAVAAP